MKTRISRIQLLMAALPGQALQEWIKSTPIRSGNARRKTKLKDKTITAAYPYAQRLNDGYSDQSPDGMSEPTFKFIADQIKKILRN